MIEILSAADVRRQDDACAERGIPTAALMARAGAGVSRVARAMLEGAYGRRVAVLCGVGNNAGDGLVAGRRLVAMGAAVTAILTRPATEMRGLAADALAEFSAAGGRVRGLDALERELIRADLAVDAVFGVGLTRAPEGPTAGALIGLAEAGVRVLAIDVPSGVDADTGQVAGAAVRANATVALGGLKPGLLFQPGRALAGRIEVHDIGIPPDLRRGTAAALEAADVVALLPPRLPGSHKRSAGTVLIVAGSRTMPGAAALTCLAAVGGGAGLTTLAAPEEVCRIALGHVPEITTIPLPGDGTGDEIHEEDGIPTGGIFGKRSLEALRPRLGDFDAVALGPGLSTHPAALDAARALLAEAPAPVITDADALTALAGDTTMPLRRVAPTVLTPHAGELARLTGRDVASLEADRLAAARAAARETGALMVFKGPGTVVCDPAGETYLTPTGDEALAQGGTGDVLTGLLVAVAAQAARAGRALDAATVAAAVWLHGFAGELGSRGRRPAPVAASRLAATLPEAFHQAGEAAARGRRAQRVETASNRRGWAGP